MGCRGSGGTEGRGMGGYMGGRGYGERDGKG